jgi:hypothetical protein
MKQEERKKALGVKLLEIIKTLHGAKAVGGG